MIALLLAAGLLCQDDLARQIERLQSDSIAEREASIHAIEAIGLPALPTLEKLAASTGDLETKLRIQALLKSIPRKAALAKVFGPTKRVTYSGKNAPLKDVIAELGKDLDEQVRLEGVDGEKPVTLDLKNATMWEAFDRLADAIQGRYEYRKEGVFFLKEPAPVFPVRYYEQFRVSVVEVKRIDYRAPGRSDGVILVALEMLYQRNMNPADKFGMGLNPLFDILGITDGKGANLQTGPLTGSGSLSSRRPFALQQYAFATPDAKTLTVEGVGKAKFSRMSQEVTLPLEGDNRVAKVGDAEFTLAGFTGGSTRNTVTMKGTLPNTPGAPDPPDRAQKFWLVAADGRRLEGRRDRGTHSRDSFTQTYQFPPADFKPEKFVFEWMVEVFQLDIPFRLEGIAVPQP